MTEEEPKRGWFGRLKAGLSRSSSKLRDNIGQIFTKKTLDQASLDELEEALIMADLGVQPASRIVEELSRTKFGKEVTDQEIRAALADQVAPILNEVAVPLELDPALKPSVVLVCGVNYMQEALDLYARLHPEQ